MTRPCFANAMEKQHSSIAAQSLSAQVMIQASRLVGRGPSGNICERIARRSFSDMSKRSVLFFAATFG